MDMVMRYHVYWAGIPLSLRLPAIVLAPLWKFALKVCVSKVVQGPLLLEDTSNLRVVFPPIVQVPLNWKL
jgi:hypothetical protein